MTRWQRAGAAALAMAALACGEGGTTPAVGFTLRAPATELAEGATLALAVESGGLTGDPGSVTWASREPAVASVRAGVVRGVGPGVTWIVARRGAAADSVRLTVRFGALASGSAAVRVFAAGDTLGAPTLGGERLQLAGFAFVHENLASRARSTWIHATSRGIASAADQQSLAGGDTALVISLRGGLAVGTRTLVPTTVETANGFSMGGDSTVHLRIVDGTDPNDRSMKIYVAVTPAQLEITSVTMPAAPGRTPGQVTGRIAFQAAGLRYHLVDGQVRVDPIGTSTVQVYAEFTSPIYHDVSPSLFATVRGQPYADAAFGFGLRGRMEGDRLVASGNGLMNVDRDVSTLMEAELRLPAPRVGTTALGADTTGASLRVSFAELRRPVAGVRPELGPRLETTSHAGTVTVTEYRAATDTDYGWIIGSVVATLSTTPADAARTETLETLAFYLPIEPRLGLPWRR